MIYFSIYRYGVNLIQAKNFGIRTGMFSSIGTGFIFFVIFCVYALSFWYGAKMVRADEMTAGNMIIVSI